LIAGGKKGTIFVMDLRNSLSLVNSFSAHETLIKSIAINSEDNTLVSGSNRGDIKASGKNN
jgi:WD40 repeat protein